MKLHAVIFLAGESWNYHAIVWNIGDFPCPESSISPRKQASIVFYNLNIYRVVQSYFQLKFNGNVSSFYSFGIFVTSK